LVTADHPNLRPSTIANVSGTAVRDRDPPICDYFQKRKAMLDPAGNRAVATRPSSDRPHRGCGMSACGESTLPARFRRFDLTEHQIG
jgi:hypothetical protein